MRQTPLLLCGSLMLLLSVAAAHLVEEQGRGLERAPSLDFDGHRLRCYQSGDLRIVQPFIALQFCEKLRVHRDALSKGFFILVPLQINNNVSLPTTPHRQWHLLDVHRFKVQLRKTPCHAKCPDVTVSAEWRQNDVPLVRFHCNSHRECRSILQSLRFNGELSRSLRASLKFTFYGVANGIQFALTRVGLPVVNTADRPFHHEFWFEGDKLLLFTIKANIGLSAFDTYQSEQNYPRSRDGSLPPVYRSSLLDQLPTITATANWEIVAEMRKGEHTVAQAVFSADPAGLNKNTWFTSARLLSSKPFWIGHSSFNFFSIAGHAEGDVRRRFFINRNYGGCPADTGLFVVSDAKDVCPWAQQYFKDNKAPALIYSPYDNAAYQSGIAQAADNFLVYLRLARASATPAPALPGAFRFEPNKILLFTVAASSNNAVQDTFLNSDIKHSVPADGKLPAIYRSELIDSLGTIFDRTGQHFIVAEMRAGNRMVSQVAFDISFRRSQLNKENWFARDRFVSSFPYPVGDSFNFFSIRGHGDPSWRRSFFISFSYGGCPADRAFWVVSEQKDPCTWCNKNYTGRSPTLVYTTSNSSPLESGGAKYDADRFLVYLA